MRAVIVWSDDNCSRVVDATPKCGVDFCDACGDCLACEWEDPCWGNSGDSHSWVVYANLDQKRATELHLMADG